MEEEFLNLINGYRGLIHKVCRIYFKDEDDKKDLFQEIVLQLWKSYPSFNKDAKESTWIYRVALNTAISNFRKSSRAPKTEDIDLLAFEIPEKVNSSQDLAILFRAIDRLSNLDKALILLYLEDKTYEEMAVIMGLTTTNIGVRLNRTKEKLNKIIKTLDQ